MPRAKKTSSSRRARFLRAFLSSAITTFAAASYALHPGWRAEWPLDRILAQALARLDPQQRATRTPVQAPASAPAPTGALVQTRFPACRQFFPGGRPPEVSSASGLRELCFSGFAVLYSGHTKTPVFVAERLNRRTLARGEGLQRTDRFYAEARLPKTERAELADYHGSGYARGHMAPAGDMSSAASMAQSFSLANMVPQNPRQNSGPWNRIEQDTRKYAMRAAGDVYVFTGPVYSAGPAAIGAGVAVPAYLYKVVYDATSGRAWVHWQSNRPDAKAGPPIAYDEFVRRTGLRLLPQGRAG